MPQRKKTFIIALGGSIIIPAPGKINIDFLKKFRKFILKFVKKGDKFIIISGGGKLSRTYQQAASKIVKLPYDDMDWLGIHATRINAHLLRTIFRDKACPTVMDDPHKPFAKNSDLSKYPVIIASGWRPGWSTDYVAVLLAKRFKSYAMIDAGNIPFVYTQDPKIAKQNGAKTSPIKEMPWKDYRKLVGSRWVPGLPSPIDPIAAKYAQKNKIQAIIIRGTDLKNFENLLQGKKFHGTIIGENGS